MMTEPRFTRYLREVNRRRQEVSAHPALNPCDKLLWLRLHDEEVARETGMHQGVMLRLSVEDMAQMAGVSTRAVHRSLLMLQSADMLRYTAGRPYHKGTVELLGPRRTARVIKRETR